MPKSPAYVVRRGKSYLFRRRPPVHPSLARCALNTRPHMVVALRTRDRREAARRAARLNVLAEAGWAMEIPDDEVRAILRALTARVASLPEMPAAAKVEAERRLNDEALRAFQGRPSRLEDPELLAEFLDEFGWPEMPSAEMVSEQLSCSIEGHFTAYDDARRRGEASVPEMEALRARLAEPAPMVRHEAAPAAGPEPERPAPVARQTPRKLATLRANDPEGFAVFAARYLDRRLAGYLCERPDEVASAALGDRFRGSSWGNYQAAARLWVDAIGNKPVKDYTPQDVRAFLALLPHIPTNFGKSSNRKPVRTAIREADAKQEHEQDAIRARMSRNGNLPGEIEDAVEAARIARLRTNTIQRYQSQLSQIFAWAVVSGLRPENPFASARLSAREISIRREAEPDPDRRPWGENLSALLGSRIYRDRLDDPGDPLFWIPLLALFAGLRLEEALQLRGSEIQEEGGIAFLSIRKANSTASVKSASSRRRVPIHSELIRLGFLRLVQGRGAGRLFPTVPRSKARNRLSETFSKWFGTYREKERIAAPGLDAHALRSDFNTRMAGAGVLKHLRDDLMGHSEKSKGLSDGAYLRVVQSIGELRDAVEKIRVEGVEAIRPPFPEEESIPGGGQRRPASAGRTDAP